MFLLPQTLSNLFTNKSSSSIKLILRNGVHGIDNLSNEKSDLYGKLKDRALKAITLNILLRFLQKIVLQQHYHYQKQTMQVMAFTIAKLKYLQANKKIGLCK